ncbi:MAG: RNA-binding transcriptional accessory protein [Candidatus Obscuribacterales bacterium]|nr:RNA-binding transcriptional accessory protein [Candidatus Obscuribacterales bacterium]
MIDNLLAKVAQEMQLTLRQVQATHSLFEEGATVPFIARYRKEATGSLDEVAIAGIRDRVAALTELEKRREAIIKSLQERSLLTEQLEKKVSQAETLNVLEDIYLPYRPKRKTRASQAKEKGLEPLAKKIFAFESSNPQADAEAYINKDKGVETAADALSGARDIIAEWLSEDAELRAQARNYWTKKSWIMSKVVSGKEEEGAKYKDYFDWEEELELAPSHRVLAIFRGENEGFLKVELAPESEEMIERIEGRFIKNKGPAGEHMKLAIHDAYKRLLAPSMETEMRKAAKVKADTEAIRVFTDNLRQLLLAPPLGQKRVLAIDPGFRTGCKVVCLDEQGKLLHHDVIHPHTGAGGEAEAQKKVISLCRDFKIDAIAIGNGTAGRETESFIRKLDFKSIGKDKLPVIMVNESGASIYSASEVARQEFPDHDVTVRGSVSIGRRLMDPLAELVKIDAKSIGVGQYQHDVDQSALKSSLDDVVVSCVNSVGVELNTASKELLSYVSGLGPQLAGNIIQYRNENGGFKKREQLKKVPRLGAKAYEQAAGFLRIRDAQNPLDASAVHPESYSLVDRIAKDLGCTVRDLMNDDGLRKKIDLRNYVSDSVGLPTLNDIFTELTKPGRDPREHLDPVQFSEAITKPEDLKPGMVLQGVVTNVTAFGAFVDVGVHQDGLVHISELADRFIKAPAEVVKVQQKVTVTVLEVDLARRRISLSMKAAKK